MIFLVSETDVKADTEDSAVTNASQEEPKKDVESTTKSKDTDTKNNVKTSDSKPKKEPDEESLREWWGKRPRLRFRS